jgi:hypothetical protein
MHDTSAAGTPTPTDPDLDEQVRDVLSHIFGEACAYGSQTSSLPVSRNRQQASTASGRNQRLRIFLQRIYIKCYPNVNDQTSHQS